MARSDHTLSNSAWLVEGMSDQKSPLVMTNFVVSSPQGESLVASSPTDGCVRIVLIITKWVWSFQGYTETPRLVISGHPVM